MNSKMMTHINKQAVNKLVQIRNLCLVIWFKFSIDAYGALDSYPKFPSKRKTYRGSISVANKLNCLIIGQKVNPMTTTYTI